MAERIDGSLVLKTMIADPASLTPPMYKGARRVGIMLLGFGLFLGAMWAIIAYFTYQENARIEQAKATVFNASELTMESFVTDEIELQVRGVLQIAQTRINEATGTNLSSGYSYTPLTESDWQPGDPIPVLLLSPNIAMLQNVNAPVVLGDYFNRLGVDDFSVPAFEIVARMILQDEITRSKVRTIVRDMPGVTAETILAVGMTEDTVVYDFGGNRQENPPLHIPALIFILLGVAALWRIRVAKPNA